MKLTFVTGCARSGTSLTTGVIGACGANLGQVNKLNEIGAVRDGIIKPYLRRMKLDPLGQYPLADPDNLQAYPNFRRDVLAAMKGADIYKCCKAPPIWRLFHEHFPEARWVIVRRDRERIMDSCRRTSFMKKHPDWGKWVDYHLECFEALKANFDCFETWTDEGVRDYRNFRPMVEWIGLEWNDQAVKSLIRPSLWHG